jgi:hypothetical protein
LLELSFDGTSLPSSSSPWPHLLTRLCCISPNASHANGPSPDQELVTWDRPITLEGETVRYLYLSLKPLSRQKVRPSDLNNFNSSLPALHRSSRGVDTASGFTSTPASSTSLFFPKKHYLHPSSLSKRIHRPFSGSHHPIPSETKPLPALKQQTQPTQPSPSCQNTKNNPSSQAASFTSP